MLVLSDGQYGQRAYKTIKYTFQCDFLILNYKGELDDIVISEEHLNKMKEYDLIILYLKNPDLILKTIEEIHKLEKIYNKKIGIIIGIWKGIGFKKQLSKYKNIVYPELMCELKEEYVDNEILEKYPQIKEFIKKFGSPKAILYIKDDKIKGIEFLRVAPCGSTVETLKEYVGKNYMEDTLTNIGLRVQHFCNAKKLNIFTDKECKKTTAGKLLVGGITIKKLES